jgi:nucleotide-binding universal stress UspA family protein
MITFRRILCPIDFSDGARRALDHAVELARWYAGSITALHVLQPVPYTDPLMVGAIVFTPEDVERTAADLASFIAEEIGGITVGTSVLQGAPAAVIVEQARTLPADLIVIGTHGRRGFERFMLGSVTERVLRTAPCPVLTVPRGAADAVAVGPVVFRNIVCGVDFSPASTTALAYAASLAAESGARLTAIHVAEDLSPEAARLRLHEEVATEAAVTEVIATGKPYRAILDRAQSDGADLIVIGVHGALTERLGFFGSTTNHIVREAACPVLSLRG